MNQAFSLTPLQEGMLLESVGSGRPWIYLEQIVCHLDREALEAEAMQQAWTALVHRHPALCCVLEGGASDATTQVVLPAAPVEVTVLELSKLEAAEKDAAFETFLEEDRVRGVDPTACPAFRVALFQLGPQHSKLVWTFPHTLLDGRSFANLLEEVFANYDAILRGQPPQLLQAANARRFQQHCETLAALSHEAGAAHFAEVLRGWEGGTGLLVSSAESGRKKFVDHSLTEAQTAKLAALAKQAGVPFGTLVMAAWGIVTARFAGRADTVFGTTLNGRHLVPGSVDGVGCFIVTVPMRLQLAANLTIGTVLEKMRADQIALRPFEQTPLTLIRAQTDVPPGVALFDTLVMFETATLDQQMTARGKGWEHRRVDLLEEGDAPVTLAAYQGRALKLTVEFDPSQVPHGKALAGHMVQFLLALAEASPQTPLAEISMLDQTQTDLLRDMSGHDRIVESDHASSAALFDAVVRRVPDQIALVQPGETPLSYRELDCAANKLAHALIRKGVHLGDVVGICVRRSPTFVIAILAIWKAGGAFVPMDPTYPSDTLNIIAKDSEAKLVIVAEASPDFDAEMLNITGLVQTGLPDAAPVLTPLPDDYPAYMIFTSGTTGRPKGVVVSHRSLAAHSLAATHLYKLKPADRALQFASLSFDVSIEEIVPTLLAGATLVLRSPEMARSTAAFLEQCTELDLTVLNLPTGFWSALTDVLDEGQRTLPDAVRLVIVGGERASMSVLRRWRKRVPNVQWINGYGTTETTITCTAHTLKDKDLGAQVVPIGIPLLHAGNWVLSADGALAPQGSEGQLWISGPAVASGYAGMPELTADRFVAASFDATLGRINGTGDRVVWSNGTLQYFGRLDRQIKLRGYRIEPGQIEHVLETQSDVGRAHVALFAPSGAAARLVAWFTASEPCAALDAANLAERLAKALPAHMRPDLVLVDKWPETPGGKIDESKLPAPAEPVFEHHQPISEETPLTQEVAGLFGEILKTGTVPATASFFDLGGNSLLLLRLLSKIENTYGVRVNPSALYANPSPRGVVRALQDQEPDPLVVLLLQPEGEAPPIYGVHVLGDNGSFFRPLAAELGPKQPFFGLTVGLLKEDTPKTVADLARFYLRQIERHRPNGPLSLIAVSAGSYVTLELAQQLIAAGRDVQALIFLDAEGPGGRPQIGKLGRASAHARLFGRSPVRYIRKLLTEKREELAHARARAILTRSQDDDDGKAVESVAAFVAANSIAIADYSPQPYSRRITIIRAEDNLFDTAEGRKSGLGWAPIAEAGFDLWDVPGDHLGILESPNNRELAKYVLEAIKIAES